ncbi:MAG: SAM-dependent chlorinase/fluorinase [Chloroflexota bacterium]
MTRPIFFLTDFGLQDTYVGIVKAVMLGITPEAQIVDLTHEIPPQDVRAGAYALMTAAPYLPTDAVVLAVVDPGVGTARRPIAVQASGRIYVGPDNGLLSWAVDGLLSVYVLDRPAFWLPNVSSTFHGRDLFGPAAAHLARGVSLAEVGTRAASMQTIPFPAAHRVLDDEGQVVRAEAEVIHVDRYGNLIVSLTAADLPPEPVVEVAGRRIVGLAAHFQDRPDADDELLALIGSAGLLEITVPNGSAAAELAVGVGARVIITRRG